LTYPKERSLGQESGAYVLQLEVSVNNHDLHHVIEAMHELGHYHLDDFWFEFPMLHLHEIFQVATIAELHEDIVSIVRLDSFLQLSCELAFDDVLVVDFVHNQLFFVRRKTLPVYDLAGKKLGVFCI
jgi:hypothetical protein